MAKKQAKPEEPAGESAPMWIVSFADLVTLMMSFFVVLYAMKQGGPEHEIQTSVAIAKQFGADLPFDPENPYSMVFHGMTPRPPMSKSKGNADNPPKGLPGNHDEVQTIRPGKEITSGGAVLFESGRADLSTDAAATVEQLANRLRGHNNVLFLKGHVSPDELSTRPDDPQGLSLSYLRATAVADALEKHGIDRRTLRPVACGAFEPVKVQAYDAEAQKLNRRVEVYSTDTVISEYFPTTFVAPANTPSQAEAH